MSTIKDLEEEIEALKRKVEILSKSRNEEHCKNSLLKAIPDIIFLMNIDGDYLDFRGGKGVVFIPQDKIIGQNVRDSGLEKSLIEKILEYNKIAIQTNEVQEFQYDIVFPDGKKRYYESRSSKYDNHHVVRIVRDVTLEVEAKIENENYIQSLKKNAFDLSHNVRLHIANIIGLSSLIDNNSNQHTIKETATLLKESTQKLDSAVNNLNNDILNSIEKQ